MQWYIQVLGSYDCVVIGPFNTEQAARNDMTRRQVAHPQFDYWLCDQVRVNADMKEFGIIPIQSSND